MVKEVPGLERVALAFAEALVGGDFDAAHRLLAESARARWTSAALRDRYVEMVGYFSEPPGAPELEYTLDPGDSSLCKRGDLGEAYVSIHCADEGEGVLVVACREGDGVRIRRIEWGRP